MMVKNWMTRVLCFRSHSAEDPERGDVPGWVLITLMTAALVAAIWAVAQEALVDLFTQAMARFTGR